MEFFHPNNLPCRPGQDCPQQGSDNEQPHLRKCVATGKQCGTEIRSTSSLTAMLPANQAAIAPIGTARAVTKSTRMVGESENPMTPMTKDTRV